MASLDKVVESGNGLIEGQVEAESPELKQKVKSPNGEIRIIDGLAYKLSCPRFKVCLGPTYNQGFIKYLCSNEHHNLCATENPEVCKHENFAVIGYPAKNYKNLIR